MSRWRLSIEGGLALRPYSNVRLRKPSMEVQSGSSVPPALPVSKRTGEPELPDQEKTLDFELRGKTTTSFGALLGWPSK